jgi:multicomponent Na+:H+ antiporter subunit D
LEILSSLPLVAVAIPVLGAILLLFVPENKDNVRNPLALAISFATAMVVISVVQQVLKGNIVYSKIVDILPGLELSFRVDPLGALFAGAASILWVFAVLYSIGYMAHEHNRRRYFIFYLLSLGITMGIAFASNLFTLYLFYELLTLATYPLVVHEGNKEAQNAGIRYIIYSFFGAGLVLYSLFITYGMVGTLDFVQGGLWPKLPAQPRCS